MKLTLILLAAALFSGCATHGPIHFPLIMTPAYPHSGQWWPTNAGAYLYPNANYVHF